VSASGQRDRLGNRAWGNFANQIAPILGFAGDPFIIFSSCKVRKDFASRLDHTYGHDQLHRESIVKGDSAIYGVSPCV
jgi:hypothetical protein